MATETNGEVSADGSSRAPSRPTIDWVVRLHLAVAAVFLGVAAALGSMTALQLVAPEVGDGLSFLSHGRVAAASVHLFLYGWLAIGFLAGTYFVLPRLSGRALVGRGIAIASLMAIGAAAAAGSAGIALGLGDGRPYLTAPIFAEVLLLVGLVASTAVVVRNTVRASDRLVPAQWYLLAASIGALLVVSVGLVPGLGGVAGAMQIGFYRSALAAFWLVTAGIGLLHYLVPRMAGFDRFEGSPLSPLAFWSLAFIWAATGPVMYVYGPVPGWLQSLGAAFSIALFVPVLLTVADLVVAIGGRWARIADRPTLSFLTIGTFLFVLIPIHNLTQALRSSSAVVGATGWASAGDLLLFAGALTFWLFGFAAHVSGIGAAHRFRIRTHMGLTALGLGLMLVAGWMSGPVMGLSWAAGVNASEPTSFGEGWETIAEALSPLAALHALGALLFAAAALIFTFSVLTAPWQVYPTGPATEEDAFDLQLGPGTTPVDAKRIWLGIVGAFVVVLIVTVAAPAFDHSVAEATILADESRTYAAGSAEAKGRAIYVQENCVVCHTQSVRPIVTDVGLGPVSVGGDYAHEVPAMIGTQRLGPDLMHVGTRLGGALRSDLMARLRDPRSSRPWSIMPSYGHLSDTDLDALAEYLLSLR